MLRITYKLQVAGSLYSIHSAVVIGSVVSAINMPVLSVYILKFDVDGGNSEPWGCLLMLM